VIASAEWEQRINRLRSLSTEMLELAQAGQWDTIPERESQRRVLLEELFQTAPPVDLAPQLETAARAVLASDAELLKLAHAEMDQLGEQLKSLGQGRRVLQAYQSF
jgi:hypothetical protein